MSNGINTHLNNDAINHYTYGFSVGFNKLHSILFLESIHRTHKNESYRNIDIYYSFSRKRSEISRDFGDKDMSHQLSLGISFGKL